LILDWLISAPNLFATELQQGIYSLYSGLAAGGVKIGRQDSVASELQTDETTCDESHDGMRAASIDFHWLNAYSGGFKRS
jgi:hypothetical protein